MKGKKKEKEKEKDKEKEKEKEKDNKTREKKRPKKGSEETTPKDQTAYPLHGKRIVDLFFYKNLKTFSVLSVQTRLNLLLSTLKYGIKRRNGVRIIRGWKCFNVIIIRGLKQSRDGKYCFLYAVILEKMKSIQCALSFTRVVGQKLKGNKVEIYSKAFI